MSKVLHTSLVGKLTWAPEPGEYLIDGFSVLDVLEGMNGLEVQFELVGYEKTPSGQPRPEPPTDPDIVRKLLGGDQ